MMICRIVGRAIATHCHPSMGGRSLMLCQHVGAQDQPLGAPFVAVDLFGAALHQKVLVSTDGLGAQHLVDDDRSPIRMFVQGIVDEPLKVEPLLANA